MKLRFTLLLSILLLSGLQTMADESWREFRVYNASDGLADNSAQGVICTKSGRMVITTIGHINFYDGNGFSHIDPVEQDVFPLPDYQGHYHPYFDKYHHLWLKNKRSVTCLDLTTELFIANIDSVIKTFGVKEKVTDLFGDQEGHLWFVHGTKIRGSEVKREFPVEHGLNLQDLVNYDNRQLMLFYDNGEVIGFDMNTGKQLYRLQAYPDAQRERYYRTTLTARHNNTVLQIRDGEKEGILLSFDVEKREWRTLMTCPHKLNNLAVHQDMAYMASEYGYWTYDLKSGEIQHMEEIRLEGGQRLLTDINTIAFDRQGGMWMGTEKRGLLYSKPFTSPIRTYDWTTPQAMEYYRVLERQPANIDTYQGESVNSVMTDSRGWTWVCTRTGLALYKNGEKKPRIFTCKDGLYNEVIHSAIEDLAGDVWVCTSYGISQLVIKDGQFVIINSYNDADNVPNESFVNGRVARLNDGTILMQALDHIVAFNPASFHHDSFRDFKCYPKLTRLMVNGNVVTAGTTIDGERILDRAITRAWEINVDYNHNTLSFLFSALNYFRPLQTYFRFRIPELDKEWRTVSHFNAPGLVDEQGLLHLQLSSLDPGTYHIELQASMHPDVWIQEPFTWNIYVHEPWWRTTGVYCALGAILLLLVLLNFIMYSRNVRLKMHRATIENDVLYQLRNLQSRCDKINSQPLDAQTETGDAINKSRSNMPSQEFVQTMVKLRTYLQDTNVDVPLNTLSKTAGIKMDQFIDQVTQNISKNPYELARFLRMEKATGMLKQGDKSVEQIANECGYESPNRFVAAFFQQYRQTPQEAQKAFLSEN